MPNRFSFRHLLPRHLLRYGLAVVSVGLALLVTKLLGRVIEDTPSAFFFAAVMISAWYGGLWPGILASLLSTLVLDYFFIPPLYGFSLSSLTSQCLR